MRLSTTQSKAFAKTLRKHYGTWRDVRAAAELKDGKYVIPVPAEK